jgi:hypothetical protein
MQFVYRTLSMTFFTCGVVVLWLGLSTGNALGQTTSNKCADKSPTVGCNGTCDETVFTCAPNFRQTLCACGG